MPLGGSHLLPTDFGAVSLLAEMAETPLQGCSPEIQPHSSAPKPLLPQCPAQRSQTAVGAQPQAHPPVCAIIIT